MNTPTTQDGNPVTKDSIYAESAAIRAISELIVMQWQETRIHPEDMEELLSALYGLDMLIHEHTRNAESLALFVE